jgi:hypothetical protein
MVVREGFVALSLWMGSLKENRFRFSLKRFWRLARWRLSVAAEGPKSNTALFGLEGKIV